MTLSTWQKFLMLNNLSGAGAERELIMQSSRLSLTMYVCMYAVTLQECNYACAHWHHVVGHMVPQSDKSESEAQSTET